MRHFKHAVVLGAVLVAMLAITSNASATPALGFEAFADCPDKSVNSNIDQCFVTTVDGGHLKLGSKNTPISDPIHLALGASSSNGAILASNFDGGSQLVPGGLTGLTGLDWLSALFPFSLLAVHAEAELAGTPGNPAIAVFTGQPFALPLKVKLDNALLTSTCYIGSNTNPIALNLTAGTTAPPPPNQPISGTLPTLTSDGARDVVILTDGVFVDNSFAAPAAQNCGLLGIGLVTTLVNVQSGLPSAAGTNEAVQEADAEIGLINRIFPPNGIE
jgi:hypothetical protein